MASPATGATTGATTGPGAGERAAHSKPRKSYIKRISDHIAYALIIYTMMLIFLVAGAINTSSMSVMPYLLLMLFIILVIPMARKLEKKWERLENSELSQSSLKTKFAIDRAKLWIGTFALPIILMVICKAVSG